MLRMKLLVPEKEVEGQNGSSLQSRPEIAISQITGKTTSLNELQIYFESVLGFNKTFAK